MQSRVIVGIDWKQPPEGAPAIPLQTSKSDSPQQRENTSGRARAWEGGHGAASETAERNQRHRLPRYDSGTSRFELGVFLGLGLSALALIAPALLESGRFAANRDAITEALTAGQATEIELACCPTNPVATNRTAAPAASHGGRTS
jgi:hypothetical protein